MLGNLCDFNRSISPGKEPSYREAQRGCYDISSSLDDQWARGQAAKTYAAPRGVRRIWYQWHHQPLALRATQWTLPVFAISAQHHFFKTVAVNWSGAWPRVCWEEESTIKHRNGKSTLFNTAKIKHGCKPESYCQIGFHQIKPLWMAQCPWSPKAFRGLPDLLWGLELDAWGARRESLMPEASAVAKIYPVAGGTLTAP